MKKHKEMMRDPLAYVESIGKSDQQHVRDALSDEGRDTVLRLCLSPKDTIPLRSLGYVAAAQYIHASYMPEAQLQVIIPQHTIESVNGINKPRTQQAAERLFKSLFFVPRLTPKQAAGNKQPDSMVFATDTPVPSYINAAYFDQVLQNTPAVQTLRAQAARRSGSPYNNGSYIHYFAGHIRMHDGIGSVTPYFQDGQDSLAQAGRIISIGAKSERPFYQARMAYRRSVSDPTLAEATGQIFTRHVLPPYQPRRQPSSIAERRFDPMWDDLEALENPLLDDFLGQYDSVVRDVAHLRDYMRFSLSSLATN